MASFTLDDVRDTFSADMTAIIEGIDGSSRTLLGAQALSLSIPRAAGGASLLEVVASHAHAIYGSASLVSIDSMSDCARVLEDLANSGSAALAEIEKQIDEVRRIARLCNESAGDLRAMLTLELDGRPEEARKLSQNLLARLTAAAPAPAPVTTPSSELSSRREFNFDDDEDLPSAAGPSSGIVKDELLTTFQQEARELLVALQGNLQALASRPSDLHVAGQLERIYHTLKGAAGTVGLTDVGTLAGQLQNQLEEIVQGGMQLTPPRLGEIFRQTNRLLRASTLPEISLDLLRSAEPTAQADQTRAFFVEETEAITKEAEAIVGQIGSASGEAKPALSRRLSQLFHRLKGSALVLGDQKVADVAITLHKESMGGLSVSVLEAGLKSLHELVSADAAQSAAAASSVVEAAPVIRKKVRAKVSLHDDPELWDAFVQECQELLDASDKEVFSLETNPQPKNGLQALMRHVHTLKGAVNAVGLAPTGAMLHQVEDFLEKLAEAPILPSMKNVATFFIEVQQEVRANLSEAPKGYVDSSQNWISERAMQVMAGGRTARPPSTGTSAGSKQTGSGQTGKTSTQGTGSEDTDRKQIRVATERLDELMNLAGELVVSRSRLITRVGTLKSLQVDLGRSRKSLYGRVDEFRQQYEFSGLAGEARKAKARMTAGLPMIAGPASSRPGMQLAAGGGAAASSAGDNSLVPVPGGGGGESGEQEAAWRAFSDIELDRYEDVNILARSLAEIGDDLAEMDGQLARELTQIAEDSESFSFLISRIQAEVTKARMISAENLFSRLRLPIRDAAERDEKEISVRFEQSSVNLDKTIIDALFKPMLHLVRNAVHHGIELPKDRERVGKPRVGTLVLKASQEAGQIVVEVADDGAGLDLNALKERGIAAGLVGADVPLDSPIIKNLVFAPGISTSAQVGEVAGRGVGGDVVKRAIERLNGDIVVDSTPGKGTVFSITLPMTLVITQSLLVRSGNRIFALPLFFTERIVEFESARLGDMLGSAQVKIGDKYLPVRRLEQVFGQSVPPRNGPVVVLRIGDRRLALQVDSLLAREEVVVKSLGDLLGGHPIFAGITMRGNGELVLIVDVPGLMEQAGVSTAAERLETRTPRAAALARAATPGSAPSSSTPSSSTPSSVAGSSVASASLAAAAPSSAPASSVTGSSAPTPSVAKPETVQVRPFVPPAAPAAGATPKPGTSPGVAAPAAPPPAAAVPSSAHPAAPTTTPAAATPTAPPAAKVPVAPAAAPAPGTSPGVAAKPAAPPAATGTSPGVVAKPSVPAGPATPGTAKMGLPSVAPPAAPAAAPVAAVRQHTVPPRILFVDDSLSVRKVAEKVLVELGVAVTVAVDGADALEKLRRAEFDLVFTDLEMPRVHGYELIREVRFLPRYQTMPIVVVSSRSGSKHQDQARQLGATDYLTKPFTAQMLEEILKKYLSYVPDRLRKT